MFKTSVRWVEDGKAGVVKCNMVTHHDHGNDDLEHIAKRLTADLKAAGKHASLSGAHVHSFTATVVYLPNQPKWDSRDVEVVA